MITEVKQSFNHDLDDQVLDKDMKWSIQYACTYTGLMYDKNEVRMPMKSWSILGEKTFCQKVTLLDDIREVIGLGLIYNGYSINSTN